MLFKLVALLLVYACVEGVVINLSYPNKIAFLYKDFYLIALYLYFFGRNPSLLFSAPRPVLEMVRGCWAVTASIILFSLMPGTALLAGMVALEQWLLYFPLAIIGFHLVKSFEQVERLIILILGLSLPVVAFALLQYFQGPEIMQELGMNYAYVFYTSWRPGFTTYWRVPATFNAPGQFGSYLNIIGCLSLAYVLFKPGGGPWRIGWWACLASFLGILVSGSRGGFLTVTFGCALLLLLSGRLSRLLSVGVVLGVIVALSFAVLGEGPQGRFSDITMEETQGRLYSTAYGSFLSYLIDDPIGRGAGIASNAARHAVGSERLVFVESYLGKIVIEMGILGLICMLWTLYSAFRASLQAVRLTNATPFQSLGHGLLVYALMNIGLTLLSTALEASPVNIFFWLLLGLLFGMAKLVVAQAQAQAPAASAAPGELTPAPTTV
jgi:hypothetical protein